ncbi:MAG TPA: PAS domain S-box protein [Chitinophagaceae bacterium]|jgi:PAS domain S-box-containing protein|nr:PAS domain S-box protein [Chitinophagaceae bacterium]
MAKQWTALKNLISSEELQKNPFLTLINREGRILCANSAMQRSLHLDNPRHTSVNFFTLLHPDHIPLFREAINESHAGKSAPATELYLKNGYYHPMKWAVKFFDNAESGPQYLCFGYKLVDDERLQQFNSLGEKNYQLIVEGLNAGIVFQDNKGELIAANSKAAEIYNTTLERLYELRNIESLWNSVWKVTTEAGEPVLFADTPFMVALRTGKAQSEVLNVRLHNGEHRLIHFNAQPLFENNNVPFSVVTNISDVTREKQLSGQVLERDILFRSFLGKTPNLAWVVDETGALLFASESFYKYFGLREEQAMNKKIFDLVPPSVADALWDKHQLVMENGQAVEVVEKVKWADGTNFIFHVNIFLVPGINGKKMVGGHAVNLADKYAVEKQLREANERLLLLSRATSDAIWEWDMQTGYIFRNDALMDMIGYQLDDGKGLSWWLRRIHPEDRNRVTDKIKEATDKGQHSWEDEYRFRCSDGQYKHIQDRGYVVYENGLPVKMIGSLQDVTDVKKLENELVEEKLQRQKEISEMVIRVQEKERTRIGHELHDNVNQILSTTKMFIEMLTPQSDEEKMIKAKSIEYLLSSIEEIRKLSKELVVPTLGEKGLVESIYALIEDIQFSSHLRIRFLHDTETDMLSPGKKITVFRIVQEQMKNILKYSKAKQVDICLRSRNTDIELVIKDDGIGFDPKQTHRGIGLSNIHDRTRFYGGTVDIQTSPGKGCVVTVTLPLMH